MVQNNWVRKSKKTPKVSYEQTPLGLGLCLMIQIVVS